MPALLTRCGSALLVPSYSRSLRADRRSRASPSGRLESGRSCRRRETMQQEVNEGEPGWSLAVLSDRRGQAAVLRAFDALSDERRT